MNRTAPARLSRPHPLLPRLQLDLLHEPRSQLTAPTDRYNRHQRQRQHYHHDGHARADYRKAGEGFGYDDDYGNDYTDELDTARVLLCTHDSGDPWSCVCFPRTSSKTIPSMTYDGVKCPHPDRHHQPGLEDVFTYPWTSQSYRPARPLQFGYQQGQVKPPSAATAPPFVYYTSKGDHYPKGDKQPPYSAPVKPVLSPLLSAQPSDRRLRRRDRRKPEAITTVTDLATIPEVQEDMVLPLDSISHVLPAVRPFDPDSLRLRSVDNAAVMDLRSEFGTSWPRRAMSTPRGRAWDADGFPQTPTRIFKGEYMDPYTGHKYEYDIKHGRKYLGGTKRPLNPEVPNDR